MKFFFLRRQEEMGGTNEGLVRGFLRKLSPLSWALVGLTLVALIAAIYFYDQATELKRNPQRAVSEDVQRLVNRVGELILLPASEQPTVATVTNPEGLKDQPFFANAKVGYRVLIYTNARKAILYDPVAHKIVEVSPLNIGQ